MLIAARLRQRRGRAYAMHMSTLPTRSAASDMLAQDTVLEEITRTIVERFNPRRVVLFGSRARGDALADSDYDIMVEMDADVGSADILELFWPSRWSMDVLVYTPGEVQRWKDDVGVVLYDIVRDGRVLYRRADVSVADFAPAASPATSRVRESPIETAESLALWIDRAREDFAVMEASARLDPPGLGSVCFHAHQCAEKLLKGCLIARSIRPPRTHDLRELLTTCVQAGFDLEGLRAACETLFGLWPKSRYPEIGTPTASDATAAVEAATAARRAILPLLRSDETLAGATSARVARS